jgi:hypothetical protein
MTEKQREAYNMMLRTLRQAADEIHNPGASRACGFDICERIEQVRHQAIDANEEEIRSGLPK